MAVANRLLTETLRPKSLKTIILLDRVRKALGENPLSQHLLLSGPRGAGKCVTYDTKIKIRNNFTNEIEEVNIGDFFSSTFLSSEEDI